MEQTPTKKSLIYDIIVNIIIIIFV